MQGVFVSGVTALDDGTLFASTRGVGMARSDDGGIKWTWVNEGLAHHEFWSCRAGKLQGRDVVFAGALPAHLYVSEDKGKSWRELKAFRDAKTRQAMDLPAAAAHRPHQGHRARRRPAAGSASRSARCRCRRISAQSFTELPVDPDPQECDIHRILVHPARPDRIIIANGIVGMMSSEDGGKSFAADEDAGRGELSGRRSSSIPTSPTCCSCRPASAGRCTGTSLAARAARFSAAATPARPGSGCSAACRTASARCSARLTIEARPDGYSLHAVDTDGQVFESLDGGDSWTIIADVPPVSKADFYKGLVRDRVKLANVDDIVANPTATKRWQEAGKAL